MDSRSRQAPIFAIFMQTGSNAEKKLHCGFLNIGKGKTNICFMDQIFVIGRRASRQFLPAFVYGHGDAYALFNSSVRTSKAIKRQLDARGSWFRLFASLPANA
jgi:hypothetical protein